MRAVFVAAIAILIFAGCQTPPSGTGETPGSTGAAASPTRPEGAAEAKGDTAPGAPAPPESAAPAPAQLAGPPPGSPAARALAQKLSLHAAELLQDGDEDPARTDLQQAVTLDPENKLAASLLRQISADPQATLGAQSFAYTVARGESLSRVAQRFLGDIYQFYILARYNAIKVPRLVQAGQVIRVPGRAPPVQAATPPPAAETPDSSRIKDSPAPPAPVHATAPAQPPAPVQLPAPAQMPAQAQVPVPVPAPVPAPAPMTATERSYQSGLQALNSGDKARALTMFSQVAKLEPGYRDTATRVDELTRELAQRYHRNALAAFHKQDMKTAIREWDKVLEIDPNNQTAKVNRQRAIDLSKRIEQIK